MKSSQILSCLALLLAVQCCISAANVNSSWEELQRTAKAGKALDITLMNSSHFYGKLERVTEDSIVLMEKKSPHTIARSDVFRVRYLVRRGKRALWGAAIAGTAAALVWAGVENEQKVEAAVFGAILGGAAGAITGVNLPLGPPLYQSERIPPQMP